MAQATEQGGAAATRAEAAAADLARLRRALLDAEIELQRVSTSAAEHERGHRAAAAQLEDCQRELERAQRAHAGLAQANPALDAAASEARTKVRHLCSGWRRRTLDSSKQATICGPVQALQSGVELVTEVRLSVQAADLELRLQEQTLLYEKSALHGASQSERLEAAVAAESAAAAERDAAKAELAALRGDAAGLTQDREHLQAAMERCELERADAQAQVRGRAVRGCAELPALKAACGEGADSAYC